MPPTSAAPACEPGSNLPILVFEAVAAIDACYDRQDLLSAADQAFPPIGADVFAWLELTAKPDGPAVSVGFGRTTPEWELGYRSNGHLANDPLIRHALGSPEAACWSDLERDHDGLDPAERTAVFRGRELGYREAMVAPHYRPGGGARAVLIMSQSLHSPSDRHRQALVMLSDALHRAARRLALGQANSAPVPAPPLTRRELEALYWAASGAKDKEIALAMALSPATVTGYLHTAQRKLGVRGRILAARRAAELSLLPGFVRSAAARS